jgi:hypothetical protein
VLRVVLHAALTLVEPGDRNVTSSGIIDRRLLSKSVLVFPPALAGWLQRGHHPHRKHAWAIIPIDLSWRASGEFKVVPMDPSGRVLSNSR